MIHADFYFSRGGGSILKEDPVEPIHDVLHRIADLLLIDRKAGIQHSLNGVRRVSQIITDAVEMVLCQDRLPFFGEDVVIEETRWDSQLPAPWDCRSAPYPVPEEGYPDVGHHIF